MTKNYEHHLHNAVKSLAKAQKNLADCVTRHEKILASHAEQIAELQQMVINYRDNAILSDLNAGLSGREVAEKYNLSPGRISQIKHRQ